jgi:ribosomal protein S18 acetylase RimI-like enzyme
MRRTLETIRPTLEGILQRTMTQGGDADASHRKVHLIVCAFYHESEGCHIKDVPEEGMNPQEIRELLNDCVQDIDQDIEFVGFPDPNRGWYMEGTGPETRQHSEARAAKFYLWLNEYLDGQLAVKDYDLFDAGVSIEGEEQEDENDKLAKRIRRRRTVLLVGHGDFMSLVLKRVVAGYGHYVETEGITHRKLEFRARACSRCVTKLVTHLDDVDSILGSALVHFNTGMSEVEYFGHGRFLVMATNQIPHIPATKEFSSLRSGGSLKDGWSYVVPADRFVLNAEVSVAFSDEELEDHVREQTSALKALYLSSDKSITQLSGEPKVESEGDSGRTVQFVVKRGLQVVGVATYSEDTGQLTDVAIRPSAAADKIGETLMSAVRKHAKTKGRSHSVVVFPRSEDSRELFENMGFSEVDETMMASID